MTLHSITKHTRHNSAVLNSPSSSRRESSQSCNSQSAQQSLSFGRRGTCGKMAFAANKVVELEDRRKLLIPEQTII